MLANFVIISVSVICLRLLIAFAVRHESTVVFISGNSNPNSHRKTKKMSIQLGVVQERMFAIWEMNAKKVAHLVNYQTKSNFQKCVRFKRSLFPQK